MKTIEPTEYQGYNWKRTQDQRNKDIDFMTVLYMENRSITGVEIHKKLHEEIKRRGDDYYLSYQHVVNELKDIKKNTLGFSTERIHEQTKDILETIEENIILCTEELAKRFTDRQDEVIQMEELSITDFKNMTLEETAMAMRLKEKFAKKTVKVRKIRGGSDFRDAAEMLYKWIQAKREVLGTDAPRKVAKKIDKTERKQIDITILEAKAKEFGYDPSKLQQFITSNEK